MFSNSIKKFTVEEIASLVHGQVVGKKDTKINKIATIQNARPGQITFLSNLKYESFIYTTEASAIIVKKDFVPKKKIKPALVLVDDPYISFTLLTQEYQRILNEQYVGIEEPSYIGKHSKVGENIYRGAFSYIGHHVTLGNNVKIHPHVYIGNHVHIGDYTILHAGAKVHAYSQVGRYCILRSESVIGNDGFGFAPQKNGHYKSIAQLGHVTIEDHVDIGANTVIDRATLPGESTCIREGAKLDSLIQVAHNVEIGKNTVIAAQTGISGSTKVGENCMIAGQVGIVGHLTIADHTKIGGQSGISKSIHSPGQEIFGYPAFDIKKYFKSVAFFKKLPDMEKRLQETERKVNSIKVDPDFRSEK